MIHNYVNRLITYLLDKLIGQYVDNFTSQNVQTGFLQGDIRLVDLPLKRNVLTDLTDLPLIVKKGYVGSVTLRIPYTQLRSQAWAILFEDIYIIASRTETIEISREKLINNEALFKKLILDALESKWIKKIKQQVDSDKSDSNTGLSFVASLGYRILRNIQVELRNIHIRYEDDITIPNKIFALGLVAEEMSAKSSSFDWKSKKEPISDTNSIQKLVDFKGIGLYMDPDCECPSEINDLAEIKVLLNEKKLSLRGVDYIVKPISLSGTTKRLNTPLPLVDRPRIELQMEMKELELEMSHTQYQTIISVISELNRLDQQRCNIKFRPSNSIKDSPVEWWHFAIRTNVRNALSVDETVSRVKQVVKYIRSYEEYLLGKGVMDDTEKDAVESSLDLDVIIFLREISMDRANRRSKEIVRDLLLHKSETPTGWWGYIKGLTSSKAQRTAPSLPEVNSETCQILKDVLPESSNNTDQVLEEDISEILNEVDMDAVNFFTRDRIFMVADFSLSAINIRLMQDEQTPIVGVRADKLFINFESRPQYSSWCLKVGLGSFKVEDLSVNSCDIVTNTLTSSVERSDIFFLIFEMNPLLDRNLFGVTRRLLVRSEPLTIVYCPSIVNSIRDFFNSSHSTKNIRAAAKKQLLNAKARTSQSLKKMIESGGETHKWQLSLKISAPRIVLPDQSSTSDTNHKSCVIADFGHLHISNCVDQDLERLFIKPNREIVIDSDVEEDSFFTPVTSPIGSMENLSLDDISQTSDPMNVGDNIMVSIENIMMLVGKKESLDLLFHKGTRHIPRELMLMEPFSMQLSVKHQTSGEKLSDLPNVTIESNLSKLIINMSDKKLKLMKSCLVSSSRVEKEPNKSNVKTSPSKRIYRTSSNVDPEDHPPTHFIAASFVLHSFMVQIESQNKPLAELTLKDIKFHFDHYRNYSKVDMELLSLVLADARANLGADLDFVFASHKGAFMDQTVRNDSNSRPLIKFEYECEHIPYLHHYKHKAVIEFSDLDVISNQETISELLSMAKLVSDEPKSHFEDISVSTISDEFDSFDITFNSKNVSVLLIKIRRDFHSGDRIATKIGTLSLSDMNVFVEKKHEVISGLVTVKNLSVRDTSTADSLYRDILSLAIGNDEHPRIPQINEKVIRFEFERSLVNHSTEIVSTIPHVIYVHSPEFLVSIEDCISDFVVYLSKLKNNIKAAAKTAILLSEANEKHEILPNIKVNFKILSPILVLPQEKSSNDVIVCHLGNINIMNEPFCINILFSNALVISRQMGKDDLTDIEVFTHTSKGFPILEKVDFSLKVSKLSRQYRNLPTSIFIEIEFSSSPSLSLSKQVYEQILKSLDNLVYDIDDQVTPTSSPGTKESKGTDLELDCASTELPIIMCTRLSEIKADLYIDATDISTDPMVRLSLRGISIELIRRNKYIKDIQLIIDHMSLYQLMDTNQQRINQPLLFSSIYPNFHYNLLHKLNSLSCPNLSTIFTKTDSFESIQFDPQIIELRKRNKTRSNSIFIDHSPFTTASDSSTNLSANMTDKIVIINVRLVDDKIVTFNTEYDSINRYIDVEFNDLTIRIVMETWVLLLDFFGLGSRFYDPNDLIGLSDVSKVLPSFNKKYDGNLEKIMNTKIRANMKKISIILENEVKYPNFTNLMSFTADDFDVNSLTKDGNLQLSVSLTDFCLRDLSPTGAVYDHRLFPASNKSRIMELSFFKYGLPDPDLLRDDDLQLSIKVSSQIVYIHTQRFIQEISQFVQNFFQYQDRLREIQVTSAGRSVDKSAPRASRIKMKVSCQAPILMLPVSAFSDNVIIADLGHFFLENNFNFAGNDVKNCLIDEMRMELKDMDVFTAVKLSKDGEHCATDLLYPHITLRPIFPKPLSKKCDLYIVASRNLDCNRSHSSPDWEFRGTLSSVECWLDINQYRTVRGVLAHNLGENTDYLKSYKYQAFHTDPSLNTNFSGVSWLSLIFQLRLNDVQVNLQLAYDDSFITLCRINFLETTLSFSSNSDSTRVIELDCNEISLEDLRYTSYPANKRPNVFQTILSSDGKSPAETSNCSQLHIRYTSNNEKNILDVKLKEMKSIVIFDWIQCTKSWIFTPPFEIVSLRAGNENADEKHITLYIQSKPEMRTVSLKPCAVRQQYQEIVTGEFKMTEMTFEVKESRFFVLENASNLHTHALILTLAGKCSYETRRAKPGPFSFSVTQLNLASCSMPSDSSNLLSILNPMEIRVKSQEKICPIELSLSNVLLDEETLSRVKMQIFIKISAFKIRLSFHDIRLLASILHSLPSQTTPPANVAHQSGLAKCQWTSVPVNEGPSDMAGSKSIFQRMSKFISEVHITHIDPADFVSICLIDDCIDADVPLFDIKLNNAEALWSFHPSYEAKLTTSLSLDYYNTNYFGWASVIDPWEVSFLFNYNNIPYFEIKSPSMLNVDASSHLLDIVRNTYKKWNIGLTNKNTTFEDQKSRHSNVFSPFVIVNELGCAIKYRKLSLTKPLMLHEALNRHDSDQSEWIYIPDSNPVSICFESESGARDKIKYDKNGLHYDSRHRIELLIDGYVKCHPITIDKLGTFYRDMVCVDSKFVKNYVRVVVEIVRQGTVQNKIILGSSLKIRNHLNISMEVLLKQEGFDPLNFFMKKNEVKPIPLFYIDSRIFVRPIQCSDEEPSSPTAINCLFSSPVDFSNELISWSIVKNPGQRIDNELSCRHIINYFLGSDSKKEVIHLIATTERLNFPMKLKQLPGHLITISAPICIENRLPCELKFATKTLFDHDTSSNPVFSEAIIRPSQKCMVLNSSTRHSTHLFVNLELFPRCDPLVIPSESKLSHTVIICVYDENNQLLELQAKVESRASGPISVVIFASYWIINRTCLPLVFSQVGDKNEPAAGYSRENEKARSPMPFLFSFPNKNESCLFQVRLGNDIRYGQAIMPLWSQKISIDKQGITTIQLRGHRDSDRPHLLYNIGLEVRPGRGKHSSTNMVILTARYMLDNKSSYTLNFSQYQCRDCQDYDAPIMALSGSVMTFHWPRDDLDPLLAVQKVDSNQKPISDWSGGFQIDKCDSFHIHLKGTCGNRPSLLRITVAQQGAIYRVVFTDVNDLPPPYLLKNHTRLQIFFSQNVPENSQVKHYVLPPSNSVQYALDEPMLPPILNICVEGGTEATCNLNIVGQHVANLHYENFLYIVTQSCKDTENDFPFVFDVLKTGKRIVLKRKTAGSRSQLWFYSSNGELFHEGSIAPHDPKQKIDRSQKNHYLLDVSIIAPQPLSANTQKYQLILAKADPRREKYQRWHFAEDGCLTNKIGMKCRVDNLAENSTVLCCFTSAEQAEPYIIYQDWLRPGSGIVNISVITDGPTRIVFMVDKEDNRRHSIIKDDFGVFMIRRANFKFSTCLNGFGLFFVNHVPEELLYTSFHNIDLEWIHEGKTDSFKMSVRDIQIDNQLIDANFPCVMYNIKSEAYQNEGDTNRNNAFTLAFERDTGHAYDVHVFNYMKVVILPMNVIVEEKLLLKCMQMLLPPSKVEEVEEEDFSSFQQTSIFHEGKKVYIGQLKVLTGTICFSVITAESLSSDLKEIKRCIPSLMSFANAQINIDPYDERHVFGTTKFIAMRLVSHFQSQLKSQAIKIFGTVDFLGNPMGFITDITSGVKKFYSDQNVQHIFKHFAHGIGDSTAKICSSASKLVSDIAMDPDYEKKRQEIFESARLSGKKSAQFTAGLKSMLYGFYGGVKSVPYQSYKGFKDEGAPGLFVGAFKGVVGVVAKPIGGMLDLATGSATSFRELARSSREGQPPRRNEPRCLSSSWKLLPFNVTCNTDIRTKSPLLNLFQAQRLLAKFTKSDSPIEKVVGLLTIQKPKEEEDVKLDVLISDESVYIVKTAKKSSELIRHFRFNQMSSPPVSVADKPPSDYCVYIGFNCLSSSEFPITSTRTNGPLVRCDDGHIAQLLIQLVCESYCDYIERQMTINI